MDSQLKASSKKRGNFYLTNLSTVYETILQDSGYVGYKRGSQARRLDTISKGSYYNHARYLYKIMKTFYDTNLPKAHNDIKSFFNRNFNENPNYDLGEYLDISVSIDGSYAHVGRYSAYGITFVIETLTGRPIDFELTEKCTKCDKCDDKADNGNCIFGKYHGGSGSMEIHNALILFKRSRQWGFRYTNYISDGDSKVLKASREHDIYGPGVVIEKLECSNHLAKRATAALFKFGLKWTDTPTEVTPKKTSGTIQKQLKDAAENNSLITFFFHIPIRILLKLPYSHLLRLHHRH